MNHKELEKKIFCLVEGDVTRYMQIKVTKFFFQNKIKEMFQINDISAAIMYDQQQAKSTLLALINACVSHELRNPLNSIMAQNIEKQNLYKELKEHLKTLNPKDKGVKRCMEIVKKLDSGMKVQDSSASMMSFLVQDLLDYAQIRSDKFRKVLGHFNIRNSIEKVMCIQRQKATDQNLQFEAEFVNIGQED